jgi:predicted nucleic acid-binding protein
LTRSLVYLDSSAILKLVISEPETAALIDLLERHPDRVSSALARVEVLRAMRRARGTAAELRRAEAVLSRIALLRIDEDIIATAARLPPYEIRSLDAIHIASALSIRDELSGLVSYDRRLTAAAEKLRIPVLAAGSV